MAIAPAPASPVVVVATAVVTVIPFVFRYERTGKSLSVTAFIRAATYWIDSRLGFLKSLLLLICSWLLLLWYWLLPCRFWPFCWCSHDLYSMTAANYFLLMIMSGWTSMVMFDPMDSLLVYRSNINKRHPSWRIILYLECAHASGPLKDEITIYDPKTKNTNQTRKCLCTPIFGWVYENRCIVDCSIKEHTMIRFFGSYIRFDKNTPHCHDYNSYITKTIQYRKCELIIGSSN